MKNYRFVKIKKQRRKLNTIREGFHLGTFLGIIVVVGALVGLFFLSGLSSLYSQLHDDTIGTYSMNKVADIWEDRDIVQSLAYLCSLKNSSKEKIYCVYEIILDNAEFGYHDELNVLRQPEEIFNITSLCRDVSVLFKSVCNTMGFENELVFEPHHVYNRVLLNDSICEVDITQHYFECEDINGEIMD